MDGAVHFIQLPRVKVDLVSCRKDNVQLFTSQAMTVSHMGSGLAIMGEHLINTGNDRISALFAVPRSGRGS